MSLKNDTHIVSAQCVKNKYRVSDNGSKLWKCTLVYNHIIKEMALRRYVIQFSINHHYINNTSRFGSMEWYWQSVLEYLLC